MKSAGSDSGRCRAQGQGQGTVHCAGRCPCWTPDSGHWQLSYEVKIDLCEVNLTRVQLTETCKATRQAPETSSFLASNGTVWGGFVRPRLGRGPNPGKKMLHTHWRSWSRHPIDRSLWSRARCRCYRGRAVPVLRRGQRMSQRDLECPRRPSSGTEEALPRCIASIDALPQLERGRHLTPPSNEWGVWRRPSR